MIDYPIGWTGWRDFFEKCGAAAFILLALVFCLLTAPVLAQNTEPDPVHVICTSVGGPIQLGTKDVTVGLKCCPAGSYIADPNNPVLDRQGNLICYKEKA